MKHASYTVRVAMLSVASALSLCAGSAAAEALTPAQCAALSATTVDAKEIALPTHGARVTEAKENAASATAPAHCLVSGEIAPVDPAAPPIRFNVALPLTWNGKAIAIGGGGFNGTIPQITSPIYAGSPTAVPPLARGYAIFASDSGHPDHPATQGDFMLNDEALRNYLGDALKKTRDASIAIIRRAYGRAPQRAYFIGGSTGGREALWVAGRWPADWDGVSAFYPARDMTTQVLGAQMINRAFAAPGAFIPPAKRKLLLDAAMAACDGLDGAKDGLISDVRGCNARFVPAKAVLGGKPLRCDGGRDAGDMCFSDTQLKALAVMQGGTRFAYPLASGVQTFPGYNAYTSDLGIGSTTPIDQMLLFLGLGLIPPGSPYRPGMSLHMQFGDGFIRYGWMRDPAFNSLTFDPLDPGKVLPRISQLSAVDSSDRDLSAFAARGGKLLLVHGLADMIVSARVSEQYYDRLRKTMGPKRLDGFVRFYEVPGFSHGVSNTFNLGWDYLTALENWAERGQDPDGMAIGTDVTGVPGRTRPLCRYPAWPKYKGSGEVNQASSFVCTGGRP